MLFNSLEFLLFFPIVFLLLIILRGRLRWFVLLIASYYFYMSWRPEYIVLLLLSTFADYFAALLIARSHDSRKRKLYLAFAMIVNLGILFFFKYLAFFADTGNQMLALIGSDGRINVPALLLPVGISFYTFQAMSYTIDVYRGHTPVEKNPFLFSLFVTFFPQLVAGPIERSKLLLHQLRDLAYRPLLNPDDIADGLRLLTWGMFKKVVVADRLALYVNPIYSEPDVYRGMSLILATVFFAFQIYCDFSAYTDIAIGIAKIMGVTLSKNFNAPYLARSVPEFWQRWHISLSTWFRDYLYIPLGGNRVSEWRWQLNIVIVFAVSGLWHGANWTYVIWGLLHGLMYLINHYLLTLKHPFHFLPAWFRTAFQILLVFAFVCFAWIFFRANSFEDALTIMRNIFAFSGEWRYSWHAIFVASGQLNIMLSFLGIGAVLAVDMLLEWLPRHWLFQPKMAFVRYLSYLILFASLTLFGVFETSQEFVYFQF